VDANLLAHQLRISAIEAQAGRFQRFARDAPVGMIFFGNDGAVQFANDEYLRIAGRSREELEAERFRVGARATPGWLHPERGPRYEIECVRADGTRVPTLVGLSTQQDGVAAFLVDLTSEKEAQRARQESEQRYRAIAVRLAEADRRKDEFFGMLSHELRNPLAPIQSALYILARARDDLERAGRAREVIERQFRHLARLVDDLLDVARITRGRIELRRACVDLARVVRDTVEDHRAALDAAGVQLLVQLPPKPVPVDGDETRLAQVLGNLLANSAKFTPRGGTVAVALDAEPGGTARLEVRDTGEGIDPGVLARIFEPFSQADHSLARSRGGLGLGLALVKGLVELHGGTVTLSSAGGGAGTEVVVRLPLAPAPVATAHEAREPRCREASSGARILVVEDSEDAAEMLREALELEGMAVTVVGDGAAGVAAARQMRPDLVICDIGLPGELDGYGVARALRADPGLRDVPLIALTGYAGPEDRARAREAGFDRHLAKPTGIDDLLHAIAGLVRRSTSA
jgi:signal transduction histidine kinase/ActR/RegA family two-component response regulator